MAVIDLDGTLSIIYADEHLPLLKQGKLEIKRVSAVEPCSSKECSHRKDYCPVTNTDSMIDWHALMLEDRFHLGPFNTREEALQEEVKYLEERL